MKFFLRLVLYLAIMMSTALSAAGELLPYEEESNTPALNLLDLAGSEHELESLRGQVVLVNFWASWCPPCLAEMPSMQRLATALQNRPFRLLAVNVKESRSKVWQFKKLLNLEFPTLLDSDGETTEAWEVQIYPTSFLIDAEGRRRFVVYGPLDWDSAEVRRRIETLMAEGQATGPPARSY